MAQLVVERYRKDNTTYVWGVRYAGSARYWKSYMYISLDPAVIFRYAWLRVKGMRHKDICKKLWHEQYPHNPERSPYNQ